MLKIYRSMEIGKCSYLKCVMYSVVQRLCFVNIIQVTTNPLNFQQGTIGSGVTTVPSVIPAGDGVSFYFDGNSNSTVEVDPTAKFNFFEDRTFSISFW